MGAPGLAFQTWESTNPITDPCPSDSERPADSAAASVPQPRPAAQPCARPCQSGSSPSAHHPLRRRADQSRRSASRSSPYARRVQLLLQELQRIMRTLPQRRGCPGHSQLSLVRRQLRMESVQLLAVVHPLRKHVSNPGDLRLRSRSQRRTRRRQATSGGSAHSRGIAGKRARRGT
jgi:hypothetical protein